MRMTPKKQNILNEIASWAERYTCIEAMHVFAIAHKASSSSYAVVKSSGGAVIAR